MARTSLNVRYPNLKRNQIIYQTYSNTQQHTATKLPFCKQCIHHFFTFLLLLYPLIHSYSEVCYKWAACLLLLYPSIHPYEEVCYKWAACGESCVTNSLVILSAPKHCFGWVAALCCVTPTTASNCQQRHTS